MATTTAAGAPVFDFAVLDRFVKAYGNLHGKFEQQTKSVSQYLGNMGATRELLILQINKVNSRAPVELAGLKDLETRSIKVYNVCQTALEQATKLKEDLGKVIKQYTPIINDPSVKDNVTLPEETQKLSARCIGHLQLLERDMSTLEPDLKQIALRLDAFKSTLGTLRAIVENQGKPLSYLQALGRYGSSFLWEETIPNTPETSLEKSTNILSPPSKKEPSNAQNNPPAILGDKRANNPRTEKKDPTT
jgi:hypothetical protein